MDNLNDIQKNGKWALVAMSGGVDSSVAAYLTVKAGYDTRGVTMNLYDNEMIACNSHTCCSLEDVEDARSVAFKLGIQYHVFNFKDEFEKTVIDPFVHAYETGSTPNPCIDCNRYMKFRALWVRAQMLYEDYIVTGHYGKIEYDQGSGRYLLKKARDLTKDQSYVLYSLTQEELSRTLFPLGDMTKEHTREIAMEQGFINAKKHDSQDICFVPNGDYAGFICRHTGKSYPSGDFVDQDGNVLGTHKGIIHYTIGQRKGLGLALKQPMYVTGIDVENNKVILGYNKDLMSTDFEVKDFNWIACEAPGSSMKADVRIRYKHHESPATITPMENNCVHIHFDEPQRAITPGQSAVAYDGDVVIGGGIIK